MKYEYTVDDDYPRGAVSFESSWSVENAKYVADEAAELFYNDDPDPEAFPIEITIYCGGKKLGEFEASLDFSPDFTSVSTTCPKCGTQIFDPFEGCRKIHDISNCHGF